MTDQQTERRLVDAIEAAFEKHAAEEWGPGPLSDFIEEYLAALPQPAIEPAPWAAVVGDFTGTVLSPDDIVSMPRREYDRLLAAQPSAEVERLRGALRRIAFAQESDLSVYARFAERVARAALAESDHD